MEVNTKPLGLAHENNTNLSSKFNRRKTNHYRFSFALWLLSVFIEFLMKKNIPFSVFQLLDIVFRDATLLQVTQSVTRNGKSIMLTMMLALILIYLFSLMGFVFFRDDFLTNIQSSLHSSHSHHRYQRTKILTRMSICRCQ
jgi:DNA-binding response OmpR family regulator